MARKPLEAIWIDAAMMKDLQSSSTPIKTVPVPDTDATLFVYQSNAGSLAFIVEGPNQAPVGYIVPAF